MFSLVIPFYTDYERLFHILKVINSRAADYQVAEVLLCHNGPQLSQNIIAKLIAAMGPLCRLLHTDDQGVGAAYRLGIENSNSDYVILSCSDLPFGFSDVESFGKGDYEFAVGSKAHPESRALNRPVSRRQATKIFANLRRLLFGPRSPNDSQGSLIIKTNLAKSLLPKVKSKDYLFPFEMICWYLQQSPSHKVKELPVVLEEEIGPSNIIIWIDGPKMLFGLIRLRFRVPLS